MVRKIYYNLFIRLYDKLTVTKKRLDLYQLFLKRINSGIQLSVITLSIASSFIQALDSKNYEIFFNSDTDLNNLNNSNTLTNPYCKKCKYFKTKKIAKTSGAKYPICYSAYQLMT